VIEFLTCEKCGAHCTIEHQYAVSAVECKNCECSILTAIIEDDEERMEQLRISWRDLHNEWEDLHNE